MEQPNAVPAAVEKPTIRSSNDIHSRIMRMHILVVDNDPAMADLMKNMLNTLGFTQVTIAHDGYEAMDILHEKHIDLLIGDAYLRPMDGAEERRISTPVGQKAKPMWKEFPPINGAALVECIRHTRYSPNPFVPVVMMVSPAKPNIVNALRDAGVNEVLAKPLNAKMLCERILNVVERPRTFVTSESYKGPCRRRKYVARPAKTERRKHTIQVIRYTGT
jgi:CheY-like chemotaxis protein